MTFPEPQAVDSFEEDVPAVGQQLRPLAPGLYLVATPIGNLEDITLRALRVLRSADRIACEDTRQTAKLLGHFGIKTPTVSYHLHNEAGRAEELVEALRGGGRIALVSDAGMPGIADPGVAVVQAAIAAGVPVYPVPGANAALSALVASALDTERFTFHGFLPSKAGQRRSTLERVRDELRATASGEPGAATQVFYETPHRVVESLEDVVGVFGPGQRIVLARELTKLHEEFLRGTAAEVLEQLRSRPAVRGEMVLLIDGAIARSEGAQPVELTLAEEVAVLVRGGASEKDALKQVAKARGLGKSEVYREWQRTRR
jgi:16S rRNA (cytidine1402-2'-O)-methyltransferase